MASRYWYLEHVNWEEKSKWYQKTSYKNRQAKMASIKEAAEAGDSEALELKQKQFDAQKKANKRRYAKIRELREADSEYIAQMEEKERIKAEKMLETERRRSKKEKNKNKRTRGELTEAAKDEDLEAQAELEAFKKKQAEQYQARKAKQEARVAEDSEYVAEVIAKRKAATRNALIDEKLKLLNGRWRQQMELKRLLRSWLLTEHITHGQRLNPERNCMIRPRLEILKQSNDMKITFSEDEIITII